MALDRRQRTIASMFNVKVPALPRPLESKAPHRAPTRSRATEATGGRAAKRPRLGRGVVVAPTAVETVQEGASQAAVDLAHPGERAESAGFVALVARSLPEHLVERVPSQDHGLG